ncbi:coatomer subunit delta-like [Dendronephthya gigantea]|uniref:coatomer subunit delta-like n=1 Tax=Dendronephthya gigantea TaxID=151771 RepID=UPI0010694E5E|nr:coatomer subunit delta-like [Dendronephthya gigantea]
MVLLAAAICTKAGKAIISRQFVEMSRSRVEGLLGAFPKLMNTGKQHTFVETESVRYVYQPLDKLYMLLITTKASNILEDLETLRLFSRVIPEYCRAVEEAEVVEKSFELIFAFDEIVALGYRENVNLAQIRTFTDMDSHEEKVFQAVIETQQREAKELMKRKAKELQAARLAAAKGKPTARSSMTGFGGNGKSNDSNISVEITPTEPVVSKPSRPARPVGSNKAMKLGSKGKDVDHFVDKLRSEGTDILTSSGKRAPAAKPAQSAVPTSGVHIKVDEKISLTAGRDGGLQNMEVRGLILLRITEAEYGRITIAVDNDDKLGFQLQTHPNVDKKLFNQESVLGLKQSGKAFPLNADIGVLKWRLQTKDESLIPLTINCWPSENDGQCDVNIEYELQQEEMELKDVTITIPVPHGVGAPVVGEIEGDYHYDHKRSVLEWQIPVIDESNKSGAMEFSVSGHPDDFFPVHVSFGSTKSFCDLKIKDINIVEDGMPVKFSSEILFSVEKYEIV